MIPEPPIAARASRNAIPAMTIVPSRDSITSRPGGASGRNSRT